MKAYNAAVNVSLATVLTMAGLLVCMLPADALAQLTYLFPNDSQGWQYMGMYDGDSFTRLHDFVVGDNPWDPRDGDGGALTIGQEGNSAQSPSGNEWIRADLNSPKLAYRTGRSFGLRFEVTGSHLEGVESVYIQAVLIIRRPTDITDRRVQSTFFDVPLGENGAWDTHVYAPQMPAGTIVKQIGFRVYFETAARYDGWIMVDNVEMR
jgi:hypothetical protein